ncbi:MAG: sulfotransferase [Sandaracinaceae bacterium]
MSSRRTSTRYERPHRPLVLRAANALLGPLVRRGTVPAALDESSILEAAEQRTGLLDFGDPSFRPPLETLLRSVESEARLHPIGRLITRERLVSTLANRMRVTEALRLDPAIRALPVRAPIVIVGLPRTGTTLLHRLLASDRRIRALASWEALSPARLPGDDDDARRIRIAEQSERGLAFMAPDFFAVHPIDAHAPEEDVLLLDLSFRSTVAESTLRVPTFSRWLEEQDQRPAYDTLKETLQLLWHQRRTDAHERWVLKTPHHLEWLDVLLEVFPDATLVWTHRDLGEVVPSFCSMLAHARGVFSDHVDPREIGRSWLRKGARMVQRALEVRARVPERFVDVRYEDLVRDPITVLRTIHERAGSTFTREAEQSARDRLRKERKDRHGAHVYRLADFGLEPNDLARAFEAYRSLAS